MNTDQGSQFTGSAWITPLTEVGVKISMDGRGRYLDNIFIERLWRSLKQEAVYLHELTDGFVAERVIREWIKFYNTDRPHTAPFILTLEPPANWGRFTPIKDRQCSRSSSRPAVSNSAISSSIPLLPLASLTEQSPSSFGHTNTQAYGKSEVQSE